jgi:hypothetical protein
MLEATDIIVEKRRSVTPTNADSEKTEASAARTPKEGEPTSHDYINPPASAESNRAPENAARRKGPLKVLARGLRKLKRARKPIHPHALERKKDTYVGLLLDDIRLGKTSGE